MPLPSSFLLFASSSFLSLAFNASSAFAEIKTIKFLHLFYVYIISENIGAREKKFLIYFLWSCQKKKTNGLKIWNIPFIILIQNFRIFISKLWSLFKANFCTKRQMNLSSISLNNGIWTGESFWSSDLSVQSICFKLQRKILKLQFTF